MIKLKPVNIIWDERNEEHIKKHNVTKSEVELAITSEVILEEGYLGRSILTARVGSRMLSVVANFENDGVYVVTARDASSKERQNYYEFEKNKENNV